MWASVPFTPTPSPAWVTPARAFLCHGCASLHAVSSLFTLDSFSRGTLKTHTHTHTRTRTHSQATACTFVGRSYSSRETTSRIELCGGGGTASIPRFPRVHIGQNTWPEWDAVSFGEDGRRGTKAVSVLGWKGFLVFCAIAECSI